MAGHDGLIAEFRAANARSRGKRADPMEGRTMIHRDGAVVWFLLFTLGATPGCGDASSRNPTGNGRGGPPPAGAGLEVTAAAFSPDNRFVLTGYSLIGHVRNRADWTVLKLWDLTTGQEVRTFRGHEGDVTAVVFLPDGKQALSASTDGTLRLWDVPSGTAVRVFGGGRDPNYIGLALSRDGRHALAVNSWVLELWEVPSGKLVRTFPSNGVMHVAISPVDDLALVQRHDQTAVDDWRTMLLNLADGRTVRSFPLSQRWDGPSAFSPDGKLAVSVLMAGERPLAIPRLALWEVASGRVERVLERKGMVPVAVAFTRDGQRLLAGCSEMLLEWDVSSGKEVGAVSVQGVGVAFSPDHALMLSRAGGDSIMYERCRPGMTIQVWDTAQMKLFKTLTAPPGPQR